MAKKTKKNSKRTEKAIPLNTGIRRRVDNWKEAWVDRDLLRLGMLRYLDKPLLFMIIGISLFGIVCIFSATTSSVLEKPANILEMLSTQSVYYPRLQLLWLAAGMVAMIGVCLFPYTFYGKHYVFIYIFTVVVLTLTLLLAKAGRGGMTAFFNWGKDHGIQPSELSKIAAIIVFAKMFSIRTKIFSTTNLVELLQMLALMVVPVILIIFQPDVGTALVYLFIFAVFFFVSGMDGKLILSAFILLGVAVIPVYFYFNNSGSDNFRFTRILIWFNPEAYPDEARQIINARIAIGSGGLFGKGIVSPGSFASLGFISDDHTDFIFSIVCESFGLVGGFALAIAYLMLLLRLIRLSRKVEDPFGAYIIIGVAAILIFHVIENIGMVLGILPVTGIPLPFVSYGGSNMLTNMACIGLVMNVLIRSRKQDAARKNAAQRATAL